MISLRLMMYMAELCVSLVRISEQYEWRIHVSVSECVGVTRMVGVAEIDNGKGA